MRDPFAVSAAEAQHLAETFGTPLYVVDESHLRERIRAYIDGFASVYPHTDISFASKANSTLAVLQIAADEGCTIDTASEGELEAALRAGVPAARCHLHGNNKTLAELERAAKEGVGQIVVDNFEEIERLGAMGQVPDLLIRLAPGVDPKTHGKISTGQADTKFGFNIADGSGERALSRALELGLPVVGFHCHVGSQLLDPEAQRSGGALITDFALRMRREHGFTAKIINVGGGLGVRYQPGDQPMPIPDYCRLVVEAVRESLQGEWEPTLVQEPGRSLVAESGITLYTVGVVKTVPAGEGQRTYVAVDGGLSDNPRPALYGSKYPVSALPQDGRTMAATRPMRVSGKHCETDMLFDMVDLPDDIRPGDFVQVQCTGAYNSSMASQYNRYARPATVIRRTNGQFELVQRRDTFDEMFARESLISL